MPHVRPLVKVFTRFHLLIARRIPNDQDVSSVCSSRNPPALCIPPRPPVATTFFRLAPLTFPLA